MAEVLGVVASGISIAGLAIQITTSIQQILDFWSSIKGAPTEIQNLLEELDLLAEILSTVDDNSDNDENPPRQAAAVKATRYCQNAASCIDAVVKDLSKGFEMPRGRRHWTAVKAVLKDKTMSKSLQRLERAKTMLSLAQQCYTQAQIRALEEFQRQKFQAIENLLTVPASQYTITTIASRQGSTSKSANAAVTSSINRTHIRDKRTENVTYWLPLGTLTVRSKPSGQGQVDTNEGDVKYRDFEFRPRPWIFRRGFSIFSMQLYGLWQYSFRSYRIITMEDPIYAACVSGDLGRVQRLCSQGKASPFDRTSDGWTLLHVAAAFADAKLCQWLIGQGLDGTASAKLEGPYRMGDRTMPLILQIFEMGSTPLHVAAMCSGRLLESIENHHTEFFMDFMMARHHREILNNSRCQTDILDTFRVLVEEGNSDPMATNVAGDSALHLCTGSWDDFHYLLNQDHCHVDLIQLSHEGVSLAQHHANWAWPTSSRIADFAYEQERLLEEQFYSSQSPWTPSKHDKISMLHGAVRFMRGQYDGTQSSVIYAIKLIKRLIMDGVDLHEIDNLWGGVVEGTAIDIITRSMINPPTEENIRLAEAKIIPYLKLWLETLRDANVDVKKYLQEEKILAAQKLERDLWGTTEFDWPCRTDWHVSLNEDEQEYMISVKYVVRERAKPMIDFNTPGAWVEDD